MNLTRLRYFFVAVLLLVVASAQASTEETIAPDTLVQHVTDVLLTDISTYRDKMESAGQESEKQVLLEDFFGRITATLEPVVDFNWISLNVMGPFRKQATGEQRTQFREIFKRGLVETYGRGLLTYSDQEIVVHPLEDGEVDKRKVVVNQEIRGVDQSYPLQYSMGLNRDGEWKVINVIINGINLGKTFRNQFTQAAKKYDGDLDKVIANWSAPES